MTPRFNSDQNDSMLFGDVPANVLIVRVRDSLVAVAFLAKVAIAAMLIGRGQINFVAYRFAHEPAECWRIRVFARPKSPDSEVSMRP